jgi:hypothetical protein
MELLFTPINNLFSKLLAICPQDARSNTYIVSDLNVKLFYWKILEMLSNVKFYGKLLSDSRAVAL